MGGGEYRPLKFGNIILWHSDKKQSSYAPSPHMVSGGIRGHSSQYLQFEGQVVYLIIYVSLVIVSSCANMTG